MIDVIRSNMRRTLLMIVCIASSAGQAGQVPSHLYTAIQSIPYLSGDALTAVSGYPNAYLSGSAGPDTIGVIMPALDSLSSHNSAGEETHYNPLKAELAVTLLDCATTDEQKAFAIGWISHYLNDIKVHAVVNEYGGFYEVANIHHKALEMLETKHVFTKLDAIVTQPIHSVVPESSDPRFAEFVFSAYRQTFPSNSLYDLKRPNKTTVIRGGIVVTPPPFDGREYFCSRYVEAATSVRQACAAFYNAHTSGLGTFDGTFVNLTTWGVWKKFPPMPSNDHYKLLEKALEIEELTVNADNLQVKAKVNDNKLYGRFLVEWKRAARASIAAAPGVYALISQYMGEKDPVRKAALRASLVSAVPKCNLDKPNEAFDHTKAVPGDIDIKELTYRLTLKPRAGGSFKVLKGRSPPIKFTSTNFERSKSGEIEFLIPVPPELSLANYKLQLGLSGTDESFANASFKDVDWVQTNSAIKLSICFLVDCSGSMGGSKIAEAIAAVKQAVNDTNDGQTEWAIVTYSSCGARPSSRFTMDPLRAQAAADRLSAGGDTPMAFGMAAGTYYLKSMGGAPKGRIILMADGDDNCSGGAGATHRGDMKGDEAAKTFRPMFVKPIDVVMPGAAPVSGGAR